MFPVTNSYQTPITEELLAKYPEEVQEQLLDTIQNIEFIKWLISPNRPYAKDCPHDDKGRVIVDLAHPHIIENMDYFRQPALHYLKHGCYTRLKPNSNPHSEYRKFWAEEIRRCREGYVRESDGEWVTGYCYWFLNYNPMMINKIVEGTRTARRVEEFPYFFEGIYWRFHYLYQARQRGEHAIELAKRGCAKSYTLSSILTHNLEMGESEEVNRRVMTILAAYQKEYLKDDRDGTLSKFRPALNFIMDNTPLPRLMLKNSPNEMSWQMGYKDEEGRDCGSFNSVMGVAIKDDEGKLRGKRGIFLFEEMGNMPNLLTVYDTTRKSVEDGDFTFGQIYMVGTAAEKESDFSSAKTLLYAPDGYKIYAIKNVFDRPAQGRPTFGFFFPAYINRAGCYNKDGVSDVIKALLEILYARYLAKYSADPKSVLRVIAEDPITPAEAIVKVKSSYFPVSQLNERALQLDSDPGAYNDVYVGELVLRDGTVTFKPTDDVPIRKWGVDNDTQGAIEIYEMPQKNRDGSIPAGRYIAGHDPVDNDKAESSSLSSTFVFDLWTDRIVAEFTGRKPFADDNYEICRLLCLFYNAKVLYESNKKGMFPYFQKMNSLKLLEETPEFLREKQMVKYMPWGSNKYGVNALAPINNYANELLRDWLLKPQPTHITNSDGTESEEMVPSLYFLRNRALIDELVNFTPDVNVDRIRAMGMVMIYRESKLVMYQGNIRKGEETPKGDEHAKDKFFTRNYDERKMTMGMRRHRRRM